jgi:hypothetical protein
MPNFVEGMFVKRNEKAPDFVIANLSFNEKFIDYLKSSLNAKGYANIDLKKSKEGKLYAELNDWQPKTEGIDTEIDKIQSIPF